MNLKDLSSRLQGLFSNTRGFVQQNPTPVSYAQKTLSPVLQQMGGFFDKYPTPMSYVQSQAPQQRSVMNTPVLPFIPQTTLPNIARSSQFVGQQLQRMNIPELNLPEPSLFPGANTLGAGLKSSFPILQAPEQINTFAQSYGRSLANPMGNPLETALNFAPFIGGVKAKTPANPEAVQRLKNLVNYADDMKRLGYGIPGGRGAIPDVHTGVKMLAKEMPQYYNKEAIDEALLKEIGTEGASWLKKTFAPLKALTPDLQEAIQTHRNKINVAKIDADSLAKQFQSNLNPQTEWKLVQWSQNPTPELAEKLKLSAKEIEDGMDIINKSRRFNDDIFSRAKALGVDLNYIKNHIYQVFKETPDKIDDIISARGLGKKPGFAQRRAIEDFATGMELGLTPKYTTFAQLNAAAQESLEKSVANANLAKILEKSGQLLPQSQAPANWEKITARWFPKASVRLGRENVMQQDWHAPRQLATFLNSYFGGQTMGTGDKALNVAAKVSAGAQNIALSGGIGPLNFFGIGQLIKEGTAGRFITPLKAFFRTYIPKASEEWQTANRQYIREMAQEGINIRGMNTYNEMYDNIVSKPGIMETIGNAWHTMMDKPTFGKFMNELQIGFYKDARDAFIKKGFGDRIAIGKAAEATKLFYGLSNPLGRGQGVQDTLTTVFLAPKYREGMLNVFWNLAKSLKPGNWKKEEYGGLRALSVGLATTYAMYNAAQYKLTGNFMWDNPPGKEFELVIPVGDPKDKKYVSVPWMPGFTALPRRVISGSLATAKGDVKEGLRQWGSLLSIPLGKAFELIANKDYFGNEIIGEDQPLKDAAIYGIKQFSPGYGRAALDLYTGKSTPAFAVAQALELPIRKGTYPNPYFEGLDKAKQGLSKEEQAQFDLMNLADKKGGLSTDEEARYMLGNPKLLEARRMVKLASNPNDPLWTRSTEDIRGYLAYQMASDTQTRAELRIRYPWIPQVQFDNSKAYFDSIMGKVNPTPGYNPNSLQGKLGTYINPGTPYTGKIPEQPQATPMQQLTPQQVKIASAYTASPKGSMQRRQILAANPWLKDYWNANNQYYAENPYEVTGPLADVLKSLGISTNMLSGGGFAKKPKKITIKASKSTKIKPVKLSTVYNKAIKITPIKKQKTIKIKKNPFASATRPDTYDFRRYV